MYVGLCIALDIKHHAYLLWNTLSDELKDPAHGSDSLNSSLGQSCSVSTNVTSALEVFLKRYALYNSRFTYLLTYYCRVA